MTKQKDFYNNLINQLESTCSFPMNYLYKFIVPLDSLQDVREHFSNGERLSVRASKKGNYQSISVTKKAISAQEIATEYQRLSHITGIIML